VAPLSPSMDITSSRDVRDRPPPLERPAEGRMPEARPQGFQSLESRRAPDYQCGPPRSKVRRWTFRAPSSPRR
jgi:hypothetical protein